ncbi:MAG: hypothetical protein ACK5LY_00165 [Lachnospirales bacterium]
MRKRNKHHGLVVFWVKLRQRGYNRTITGLYRMLLKLELQPIKPKNPKYIPNPYQKMYYHGERVQIDDKHVPKVCIVGDTLGKKFYQQDSLQNIEKSIFISEFSLRENDFVALVRRVLYKTMALRLLTKLWKWRFFAILGVCKKYENLIFSFAM